MKPWKHHRLSRFIKEENGSALLLFAGSIVTIFALGGGAIDAGKGYYLREKLQTATDSAALSGVRELSNASLTATVNENFNANFPANYMKATLGTLTVTPDLTKKQLKLQRSATYNTSFLRLLGIPTMTVSVVSTAVHNDEKREIVMVLDNTGSMGFDGTSVSTIRNCSQQSCNNIQAMKYAASTLIDILFGNNETVKNLWVGLVPYSATVNIGSSHADWTTGTGAYNWGARSWKGCVMARHLNGRDQTDDLPSTEPFVPFYWASSFGTLFYTNKNPANGALIYQNNLVIGDNIWVSGQERENVADYGSLGNEVHGPNIGCPPPIVPLIESKSTLMNAISAMNGFNRGGTMSNLGAVWGWRVLSPRWQGLWPNSSTETLPHAYDKAKKVAIILTDGVNEWYDWPGVSKRLTTSTEYISWVGATNWTNTVGPLFSQGRLQGVYLGAPGSPVNSTYPDADFTAYGRLSEGRLGTTNNATATTTINNRFQTVCTRMKANQIEVYTITFGTSVSSATRTLFSNCATNSAHYFDSPDRATLYTAFDTIANNLYSVRLIK